MTTTPEPEPREPYARCYDCPATFFDREAMLDHAKATMAPTGNESGVIARGHSTRVVNPTPEEIEKSRVVGLIESVVAHALDDAMEALERLVDRDRIMREQITQTLSERGHVDFAEAWEEWNQ